MKILPVALGLAALAGCSAPSVNLSTSEPIKVDISMRLDVYQHNKDLAKKSPLSEPSSDPESRRRNRMADIQNLKNARLIGEGHDGLLVIRAGESGEASDFMRQTVANENEDRVTLMKTRAEKEKRSLSDIQSEQAALWRQRSFEGELMEALNSAGAFEWIAKPGQEKP